jgi:hypothetical protein
MRKKLRAVAVAGAAMSALAFAPAGASAAHCTGTTEAEMAMPGFSYFGTDHVQGEKGQPQGRNHAHTGASACRDATGSPSDRAPGQNR